MEQGQNSGAYNSLMIEMEEMLKTPATATEVYTPACLISWVSDDSAQYNYKPDKVHIGPLHLNPSHWMEKEKKKRLRSLLDPHASLHQEELQRALTAMEGLEDRARQCYNRTFNKITKEEFVRMLLLDGYFLYSHFVATTEHDVPVASTDITVVRDVVFLLENQIPFFVLEEIHKLITPRAQDDGSAFVVVNKVTRHVEALVRRHGYVSKNVTFEWRKHPCHLLHLLYMYFRPTVFDTTEDQFIVHINGSTSSPEDMPTVVPPACWRQRPCDLLQLLYRYFRPTAFDAEEVQLTQLVNGNATSTSGPPEEDMTTPLTPSRWRAATYYYVAGVRLVKRELDGREARSILDVELIEGTLHIPCLMVDSNTLRLLRNMVTLEQHNPLLGSHVTAYCLFMSQMANTEKDVALLVTKGIIVHLLHRDDDVATGLAELCDDVILNLYNPKLNYLRSKQEALEKLCRDGWRKSMAWLRHSKCSNYLMALAVVAAFVVFICTVEQSVFAALSYARGRN